MQVAFLHVGADHTLPAIFVKSVRRHNPGADIVQVSDEKTGPVSGVSRVLIRDGDVENLLLYRLQSWATFPHEGQTIFCDTDMICLRPLSYGLDGYDAVVCKREFHAEETILPKHAAKYCPEYKDVPIGEAFPYLGCYSVAATNDFWSACYEIAKTLPPKPRGQWYSEQEALKRIVRSGRFKVKEVPERLVAHLPDIEWDGETDVRMMHFKGVMRKRLMLDVAKVHGYI